MHFTVYKTTNKINNKQYIGVHQTDNPMDDYLGSGKYLKIAIKKYGKENFEKEILFDYDNPIEMFAKELELVTEDIVKNRNYYNATVGGEGGFQHIHMNMNKYRKSFISQPNAESIKNWQEKNPELAKKACQKGAKSTFKILSSKENYNSYMSKISLLQKGKPKPRLKEWIWITDGDNDKRIHKSEEIPNGWKKGKLNKHIKRKKIERNCIVCGKEFTTVPSLNKRSCSRICANISKSSKFKNRADSDLADKVSDDVKDKLK